MEITQLGFSWMNEVEWRGEFGTNDDGGIKVESSFVSPKGRRKSSRKVERRTGVAVCVFYIYDVCF